MRKNTKCFPLPPIFLVLLLSFGWQFAFSQEPWKTKVAPELRAAFQRGETADFLVVMREQADVSAAQALPTKSAKAHYVYERLEAMASRTQVNARRILKQFNASSNSLFLVNALAVENGNEDLARQLATLPEVASIAPDPWIKFSGPVRMDATAVADRSIEWGVSKINAPDVWVMGYTGQGITVGGADTGYDWHHPAIQTKYRGWNGSVAASEHNYNWHDAIHEFSPLNYDTSGNPGVNPCGLNITAPCDDNSHGTHTMGTMTGDDGNGNLIGVAPGARWIGCRNMERGWGKPSSYVECFQWFMAPTDLNNQNPNPDRSPHVINNSWYCAVEEGCVNLTIDSLLLTAVVNLKASGVVVVVSNGNFGPACNTATPPALFGPSFSVGATNEQDYIAKFSSRGPVWADSSGRIKPNVSAPGVNVRSSVLNNGYAYYGGTSMAGPHVVGLVALVLSAQPLLAGHVDTIERIIEQTSVFLQDTLDCSPTSLGSSRPNHAYGWGRVDALAAVKKALLWSPDVATQSPAAPEVRVFPNPVGDEVWFDLNHVSTAFNLSVYNIEGALLYTKTLVPSERVIESISMRNYPAGVYLYKISSESTALTGKLVKN
jgi:subtilisin family serine protease